MTHVIQRPDIPQRRMAALIAGAAMLALGAVACGGFVVPGGKTAVSVRLNGPYRFERGDTWVVTRQLIGLREVGPVVLKPATA